MGANDIVVTVGGIIPSKDYKMLEAAGVKAIFGPGTQIPKAARRVLSLIAQQPASDPIGA
jgi:methylmalonyl-CoA mutase